MRFHSTYYLGLALLAAGFTAFIQPALAQEKTPITEQVDVIRQYKPVLGDAVKIKKSPAFFDDNTQAAPLKYSFKNLRLLKDTARNNISADSLRSTDSLTTPFMYLKAGGGNLSTALGEIYLNSRPTKDGYYGGFFKHLSQQGKLANQQFFSEQAQIFGKKIFAKNFLEAALQADERQNFFYGYDHSVTSYSKAQARQHLLNIGATLDFGSNADSTAPVVYGLKAHGNNFSDHYSNKENLYELSGMLAYNIGTFAFNLSSAVSYNKLTLNNGQTFNTSVFRAEPYITLQNKLFRAKAGLNIIDQSGNAKKFLLFPDLSLDLLLSYGFNLYGGLKGDVIQNTYQKLTEQNPWTMGTVQAAVPAAPGSPSLSFANNLALKNTKQTIDFFAGIKGAFSPELNYRAQVETGLYDNLYFFVNSPLDTRYFIPAYAGDKTTKEEFYAELNYLAASKLRININLDYVDFRLKAISNAWHTPKLKSGIWLKYNPSSQWMIHGSLYYTGTQKAETYNTANSTTGVQTLSAFTDISLGAEYRITRKVSVFINGNNLLNKKYQNFLNYPVLGLNAVGGVTISL